ncbi:glycosyltransferase, partial [bacterium]|nr:glycosyltransferase [bacterium]
MNDIKLERKVDRPKKTSLIVVMYNFAENVAELYHSIVDSMEGIGESFELVFVDDGSTDSTYNRLVALAKEDKRIRIVKLRSMFGEASALDAGLQYSTYDRIIYLSGRVRVNPSEIPKFLQMLDEGYDLIVGWRYPRRDSLINHWISRIFNWLV